MIVPYEFSFLSFQGIVYRKSKGLSIDFSTFFYNSDMFLSTFFGISVVYCADFVTIGGCRDGKSERNLAALATAQATALRVVCSTDRCRRLYSNTAAAGTDYTAIFLLCHGSAVARCKVGRLVAKRICGNRSVRGAHIYFWRWIWRGAFAHFRFFARVDRCGRHDRLDCTTG